MNQPIEPGGVSRRRILPPGDGVAGGRALPRSGCAGAKYPRQSSFPAKPPSSMQSPGDFYNAIEVGFGEQVMQPPAATCCHMGADT